MAFTTEDRDALKRAIARGVSSASLNGESVTFRSLTEMRATLRMIEEELAGAQGPSLAVSYPRTTRGL